MGRILAKKPFIKYWIAGDDMEYGHAITESTWKYLKAANPKVQLLGQSWWKVERPTSAPTSPRSWRQSLTLILGNSGASVIGFQKAAKATGLAKAIALYQHTAIDLTILQANGMEGPEGVYGTCHYLFNYPQTPENKAFVAEYYKLYNSSHPALLLRLHGSPVRGQSLGEDRPEVRP